ncbi:MAG: Hydrolase, TatD family [Candidatus Levybacteria bacterium GW2011_GWA1_37_16]|nr:MAG: Hydrolase, TatD family [Candidatus Levybacteria bacterium GW2011_GWA1_37_16]
MFHCFAGSMEILKSALQMGFYVGFDGNITYNGLAPGEDTDLKDLVKYTPIDRIVIETDSPFLTPVPKRGSRNMPEYVIITAKFIAILKGLTFEEFEVKTTENAIKLFNL